MAVEVPGFATPSGEPVIPLGVVPEPPGLFVGAVVIAPPGAFAPAAPAVFVGVVVVGGTVAPDVVSVGAPPLLQPSAPTRSTAWEIANPVALFTLTLPLVIETRLLARATR